MRSRVSSELQKIRLHIGDKYVQINEGFGWSDIDRILFISDIKRYREKI